MTLFELAASLGLDISEFETNAKTAEDTAKSLEGSLGALAFPDLTSGNLATLDSEIAELDEEIKALNEEIEALELDLEIDALEQQNSQIEREIANSERRTSAFAGVVEGVANAAAEFVGDLMNEAFEFVDDSFEKAANSGSDLARRYQSDISGLNTTVGLVQDTIGNALLSLTVDGLNLYETLDNALSFIFGFEPQDKLDATLKQLSEYEFSNLEEARQSLHGIFSMGETASAESPEMDFESVVAGYESQALYWSEYSKTITDLYSRGVSSDTLSAYLSGSTSDMGMLQWFQSLTDAQIVELENAQAMVSEAESTAAQTIAGLRLSLDEEYRAMLDEADRLEQETSKEISELSKDPNASAAHLTESGRYSGGGGRSFDDAVAELQTSIDALPGAIASALSGAEVSMDGETVGSIVFPHISSELRRMVIKNQYAFLP